MITAESAPRSKMDFLQRKKIVENFVKAKHFYRSFFLGGGGGGRGRIIETNFKTQSLTYLHEVRKLRWQISNFGQNGFHGIRVVSAERKKVHGRIWTLSCNGKETVDFSERKL